MRLLLANDTRYDADIRCRMVVDAKRVLTEQHVSKLILAAECAGRDNGSLIIDWAFERKRLPGEITLVDRDPRVCRVIGKMLLDRGYRALDLRNYIAAH